MAPSSQHWEPPGNPGRFTFVYDWVFGEWHVPSVTSSQYATYSALWVGLNGDGTTDLIQNGSGQDSIRTYKGRVTTYFTWVEYLPNNLMQLSFPVSPGDDLWVESWVGDNVGNLNVNGGFGWYYFEDFTTNTWFEPPPIAKPPNAPAFTGASAEWIMERQQINGVIPELSDYVTTNVFNANAGDSSGNGSAYDAQNSNLTAWTMIGCNHYQDCTGYSYNTLSVVSDIGNDTMQFLWENYY